MRVILHGPVTADHLADAELMAGITPTSFVTNGLSHPPRGSNLPVEVMAPCMKQPAETRIRAREYSMVQAADALICADGASCRHQIADFAERPAIHPAEALARRLKPAPAE